jgi:hypothetical protein
MRKPIERHQRLGSRGADDADHDAHDRAARQGQHLLAQLAA